MKEEKKEAPNKMGPQNMGSGEKPKAFFKTLKRILQYSNKYLPAIIISLSCALIGTILMLLGPSKISDLTNLIQDGLTTSINMEAVLKIVIILIVFYSLSWILNSIQGFILAGVTQKISYRMRGDISRQINALPMSF